MEMLSGGEGRQNQLFQIAIRKFLAPGVQGRIRLPRVALREFSLQVSRINEFDYSELRYGNFSQQVINEFIKRI